MFFIPFCWQRSACHDSIAKSIMSRSPVLCHRTCRSAKTSELWQCFLEVVLWQCFRKSSCLNSWRYFQPFLSLMLLPFSSPARSTWNGRSVYFVLPTLLNHPESHSRSTWNGCSVYFVQGNPQNASLPHTHPAPLHAPFPAPVPHLSSQSFPICGSCPYVHWTQSVREG